MRHLFVYLLMILLILQFASAATIHGNIYNMELEKQNSTIVTVDSDPKQNIVSKDGTYSFELPTGTYTITARYEDEEGILSTKETITISKEGSYVLDLILFPSLEEEEDLLEQIEEEGSVEESNYIYYAVFAASIILLIFIVFLVFKYRSLADKIQIEADKNDITDMADDILKFIKSKGGRVSQKEIRQNFPSSEAKISLVITELEHKGTVERIKKGRGNIIVLKK